MASSLLRFKRGNAGIGGTVPALKPGEPAFSLNNFDLFVGFNTTVSGNKFFGSHRYWTREDESTRGSGINLVESTNNGSNYITLAAPASVGSAVTYYFPANQGTVDSVLINDGNGDLSWSTNIPILSGIVTFTNVEDSYSKDSGAVIIEGGLGVEKNVNIGGSVSIGSNFNVAGIGTIPTFNSQYSTIEHVRGLNLSYTGIGTVTNFNSTNSYINTGIVTTLRGIDLNYSGIGTIVTFNSTTSNISSIYNSNLYSNTGIVTTLRGTNLNYSGVGTIANVVGTNLNYTGIGTIDGTFNVGIGGTVISTLSNGFVGVLTTNTSDDITLYKNTRIANYGSGAKLSVGRITSGLDSTPGSLFYPESGTLITNSTNGGYYLNNLGTLVWYVDYNGNQYNKGFVRVGPTTNATNITLDPNGNISAAGISTSFSVSIGSTQVISNERQLQNILSLDAITISTIETAVSNAPNTFTDLKISGISTFIGIATFASGIHVVSGVTTLGVTTATDLTLQNLRVSGLGTIATLDGTTANITNANIVSGIVTTLAGTNLNYSGIATLPTIDGTTADFVNLYSNVGVVTTLRGTDLNYSGVGTITNVVGTNLNYSGVGTVNNLTGTNLNYSGIATLPTIDGTTADFTNLYSNVGVVTSLTTTNFSSIGFATISNLSVSGFSTFSGISTFANNAYFNSPVYFSNSINVQNGYDLYLSDNSIINFGDGNDLKIYHNGTSSVINNLTGELIVSGDSVRLQSYDFSETYLLALKNSSVELYFDNAKKLETVGTGVSITGTTFTNQLSVSGVSTFLGNASFNTATFGDSDTLDFGDSNDLRIFHDGTTNIIKNQTGSSLEINLGSNSNSIFSIKNQTETLARFYRDALVDGKVELYYDDSKKFETIGAGVTVTGTTFTNKLNVSDVIETNGIIVSGISTVTTLTGTNLNYSGIATLPTIDGTTADFTNLYSNVGVVTTLRGTDLNYSGVGTITNVVGTNLNYSGIATLPTIDGTTADFVNLYSNVGVVTTLRGTNYSFIGIGTISNLNGINLNFDIASIYAASGDNLVYTGLSTITTLQGTTLNYSVADITALRGTNLNYSGISTVSNILGTNLNYSGIGTISTINGTTLNYSVADITSLRGTNLNYSGISTATTLSGSSINYTTSTFTNASSTNLNVSGIATVQNLLSTVGIVTNLSGTNLNYSGIGTFGEVRSQYIKASDGTSAIAISNSTGNVQTSSDLTVSGNLYVNGTTTQINTTSITVEDRTIELGIVDGSTPSVTTTWDLGILFNYYQTSSKKSAFIWEQSDSRFKFGSEISESVGVGTTSPQITFTSYAPIEVSTIWINDCAGQSSIINCSSGERLLENITVDCGTY